MHGFESHQAPHKKDFGFCQGLFYLSDEDENPFEGSSASELRLECFCDWTKSKKQNTELPLKANEQDSEERAECGVLLQRVGNSEAKHVDTFNASDSRQSHQAPHKILGAFCYRVFYLEEFVGL